MDTEQPLYYHMHVGTIHFYLSLTLSGQLGSSNHSALFILSYQELVTYTFIIDPSVCTFDSALSFLVICVKCYIGPCGVLVPTGTCTQIMNLNYRSSPYASRCYSCASLIPLYTVRKLDGCTLRRMT